MDEEIEFDAPMSEFELALAAKLSAAQLEEIDRALLANASYQWRKVARIVGTVMSELPEQRVWKVLDTFYVQRVARLVELGFLQSQGDLRAMRYSEVRLPSEDET